MKKILAIVSIAILVACAAYTPVVPTQSDADRAAKNIPGITLADLNQGKTIFEENCQNCHSLKKPFTKTVDEIRSALPNMAKKAKIDAKQEDLVLKYLLSMVTKQESK